MIRTRTAPAELPGPRTVWTFRDWFPLLMGETEAVQRYYERYGPVFRVRVAGLVPLVFLIGPDANKLLSSTMEEGFSPGFFTGLGDLLEGTLMGMGGEEHRRHRKLLGIAYKPLNVNAAYARAAHVVDEHLRSYADEGEILLVEKMVRLTFDLHLRTLGLADTLAEADWYYQTYAANPMALISPRWLSFPGSPIHRAMKNKRLTVERMLPVIRARRAEPRDDLLSTVIHTRAPNVPPLTDEEVAHSVMGNYLGVYGMGLVLTKLIQGLHETPTVAAELHRVLSALPADPTTPDDFRKVPYLDHCIYEAERFLDALIFRRVERPFTFRGYRIDAGSIVPWAATFTHRAFIDRYQEFDPSRFAAGAPPLPPFSFAPYGLGTRACLGMHLARAHMRLIASRFVRGYRVVQARYGRGAGEQRLFHAVIRPRVAEGEKRWALS